jgi:hypothetical protein
MTSSLNKDYSCNYKFGSMMINKGDLPPGTNLIPKEILSIDGTIRNLQSQIMQPTHQYNRRTLLLMQNLHNNYLYSANTGILFTMRRGCHSGMIGGLGSHQTNPHATNKMQSQTSQSYNILTSLGKLKSDLASGAINVSNNNSQMVGHHDYVNN